MPQPKKKRFGKGLLTGAILGIAAGIFMSSKEGKDMAKKLHKKASEIEKKLKTEFKKQKAVTEDAYGDSIDTVLAYYTKSKKIAKSEVPALKKYLLSKWKLIKTEMEQVQPKKQSTKKSSKKK